MKKLIAKKYLFILSLFILGISNAQNIYTFAGNGSPATSGDGGPAINAEIYRPRSLGVDLSGNVYFSAYFGPIVRKIDTQGIVTTYTPAQNFNGSLHGITFDASNNMYCSTSRNIYKITPAGVTSSVVGTGTVGYSGDGGPAINAKVNGAGGIAFDALGNFYFSDRANHRVRKVDLAGNISTIAGNGGGGFGGDGGQATSAQLDNPQDVAVDAAGNVFIADTYNERIRKVNTSGVITTICGTGVSGSAGLNGPAINAELVSPRTIEVDVNGNLYICDGNWIKKINTSGIISAIAGGSSGFFGDGGPAINGKLNNPDALGFDPSGNLYIGDEYNNRIRLICYNSCPVGIEEYSYNSEFFSVYPNPATNILQIKSIENKSFDSFVILDVLGRKVLEQKENTTQINIQNLEKGMYQLILTFEGKNYSSKFIKE
jgi:hypothetical protein